MSLTSIVWNVEESCSNNVTTLHIAGDQFRPPIDDITAMNQTSLVVPSSWIPKGACQVTLKLKGSDCVRDAKAPLPSVATPTAVAKPKKRKVEAEGRKTMDYKTSDKDEDKEDTDDENEPRMPGHYHVEPESGTRCLLIWCGQEKYNGFIVYREGFPVWDQFRGRIFLEEIVEAKSLSVSTVPPKDNLKGNNFGGLSRTEWLQMKVNQRNQAKATSSTASVAVTPATPTTTAPTSVKVL